MTSADHTSMQAVRETLSASRDPRVPRTRQKILAAVEKLVACGAPVSVSAIVREAGVSKTTFYSHFSGFDELALQIAQQAYTPLGDLTTPAEDDHTHAEVVRRAHSDLIRHYVEHRDFYAVALALPLSREVHTRVVRAVVALIEPLIEDNPHRPAAVLPRPAASFIASAVVGFLDEWLEGDFDASEEELLEHLLALLPAWYSGT